MNRHLLALVFVCAVASAQVTITISSVAATGTAMPGGTGGFTTFHPIDPVAPWISNRDIVFRGGECQFSAVHFEDR